MRKTIYRTVIFASALILILSCSQKYDDLAVNPEDPDFITASFTSVSSSQAVIVPVRKTEGNYLYLGTDTDGVDTTAFGEILFNFGLFNTDSLLDSAYVMMPVFNDSIFEMNTNRQFDIFTVRNNWTNADVQRDALEIEFYASAALSPDSASPAVKSLRIPLEIDSLRSWFTTDSLNSKFNGFLIRSKPGEEISPIVSLYSSKWAYDDYVPKVQRFRTDTLTAFDGITDSLVVVKTESKFTADLSFTGKKSETLDLSATKFKVGGISGEGYLCRFDLDSIPKDATVISSRLTFTNIKDETDPVYGDLMKNGNEHDVIRFYKAADTLWTSDPYILNYDSLNYWEDTRILSVSDSTLQTFEVRFTDRLFQEWIKDPSTNHGIYFRSGECRQPYGFMTLDGLKIEILYVRMTE